MGLRHLLASLMHVFLKLQVSFRKTAANYRALLQKMTYKEVIAHVFLPPVVHNTTCAPQKS